MASKAGMLSFCTPVEAHMGHSGCHPLLDPCPLEPIPSFPHLGLGHLDKGTQGRLYVCLLPGGQQTEALQQPQLGLPGVRVRVEFPQELLCSAYSVLLGLFPAGRAAGTGRRLTACLCDPHLSTTQKLKPLPALSPLTCYQSPGSQRPLHRLSRRQGSGRSVPCGRWQSDPRCCPFGLCSEISGLRWAAQCAYKG